LLSNNEKDNCGLSSPHPPSGEGGRGKLSEKTTREFDEQPSDKGGKNQQQNIVILGIGNILLSDEGIGVHVANELFKRTLPENVSVVEGGTDGFRLLNVITEADRLIIIDAVRGGSESGSLYRFDIDDVKSCPSGFKTSVHQIGILEVIDLSGLIGKTPDTTIIGIEPKSLEMGMELSPEIREKIPRIIELVLDEVRRVAKRDA
jgi:hydrogenase maturation protease